MPLAGFLESLHIGLGKSEERLIDDALSILSDILPDNANFTTDDASDWERRLGLITNTLVSLEDRKLAIQRKLNFPGEIRARQSWQFLQSQLQDAGFNVFVFENRFPNYPDGYITKTPFEVSGDPGIFSTVRHGQRRHGEIRHGAVNWKNKVVNYIDENLDLSFQIGSDYRSTFFVGGNPVGAYADVHIERKDEFRQLILKIKPVQTVGFLFINYV